MYHGPKCKIQNYETPSRQHWRKYLHEIEYGNKF